MSGALILWLTDVAGTALAHPVGRAWRILALARDDHDGNPHVHGVRHDSKWKDSKMRIVLALAIGLAIVVTAVESDERANAAKLKKFTKTDTVPQSGDSGVQANGARITSADDPFTFEKVAKIRRLTEITITATLSDADAGPGDPDENQLTLALDGIDTGILLNGFRDDSTDTLTISGVPDNKSQILAALKTDGELAATIVDASPDDNGLAVPATFDTILVLEGKQKRKKR
ncbi:MAG: hypothetical protein ACRDJC_01610 [Thermomicrobiales bacterium]